MANLDNNTVSVIGGRTNTITATIHLGIFLTPVWVTVDPKTNTIYTATMTGMSVISGRTNTITATLAVPSPATVAVNPKTGLAYLTNSAYTSGGVSVLGPCPK